MKNTIRTRSKFKQGWVVNQKSLQTGSKFNQGWVLIQKSPPNVVRIQSRMGLDSKIPSEQGRNSIKERSIVPLVRTNLHPTILSHFSETVDPTLCLALYPAAKGQVPFKKAIYMQLPKQIQQL